MVSLEAMIAIGALIVILRVWPLIVNFFESNDTWFHMWRCEEIQRNGYKIPIVALTANAMKEDKEKA